MFRIRKKTKRPSLDKRDAIRKEFDTYIKDLYDALDELRIWFEAEMPMDYDHEGDI